MSEEPIRRFGVDDDDGGDVPMEDAIREDDHAPPVREANTLDALRAEVTREVTGDPVTLAVPGRDGWSVRYRCDLEVDKLTHFRKKCRDRAHPDGINELKLAKLILADQSDAFIQGGVEVLDEDGDPLTFRSEELLEMMDVDRTADAVQRWYALDGPIMSHSNEVVRASGFDEEVMREEDPTRR